MISKMSFKQLNSNVCITCGHDPSVAVVPEPDEAPAKTEEDAIADLEAELEDMTVDPSFILNPPNESRYLFYPNLSFWVF